MSRKPRVLTRAEKISKTMRAKSKEEKSDIAKKKSESQKLTLKLKLSEEKLAVIHARYNKNEKLTLFINDVLYPLVLAIKLIQENPDNIDLFSSIKEKWEPICKFVPTQDGRALISCSLSEINKLYGRTSNVIFKKIFKCKQQGGFSSKESRGFNSLFEINDEAFLEFYIARNKSESSNANIVDMLNKHLALTRISTEHTVEVNKDIKEMFDLDVYQVTAIPGSKEYVSDGEKAEIRQKRKALQSSATEKNDLIKKSRNRGNKTDKSS